MSFDARVTAKLIGETALAGLLLAFAAVASWAPIPSWLKLLVFIPTVGAPTLMVVAAAIRHLQGGSTDFEMVEGVRRFSASGIRFGDLAHAIMQGLAWHRRFPMVRPVGRVLGNPADPNAVREDPTAASLPEAIEAAASTPEVPPEAAGLEIRVGDAATTDDRANIEESTNRV